MMTLQLSNVRHVLLFPVLSTLALAVISVLVFPTAGAGEEIEALHCYAGTFTTFHGSQELKPLITLSLSGIITSPNKSLNNAATHCEGVARAGEGYGVCKVVDSDGDIFVYADPYSGTKYPLTLWEGTGKWKGIAGSIESEQVAIAAKPAVPGSFHVCSRWKGTLETRN